MNELIIIRQLFLFIIHTVFWKVSEKIIQSMFIYDFSVYNEKR